MAERDSAVLEELQGIDTAVIDQLLEIKEQRQELEARLSRLAKAEGQVSDVVYQRVWQDYQEQRKAFEQRAAPLVDRARSEFQKLAVLLKQAEDVARTAQFDEEELEVRHRVGEYDEEDFKSRVAEVRTRLKAHKRDLEAVSKVRDKFVAAIDSEEVLAEEPPAAAKTETPGPVEETPPEPEEVATPISKTVVGPLPGEVEVSGPGEPPPAGAVAAAEEESTAVEADAKPPAAAPAGTQLLPIARLIPLEADSDAVDSEAQEYAVQPITTVGRGADNQVQIDETAVSRRHAQIVLESEGFVLRDLDSQNGTYVNGDPIKESLLADGDRIQIGTSRFVFRPA